jgi:hypothetical protein
LATTALEAAISKKDNMTRNLLFTSTSPTMQSSDPPGLIAMAQKIKRAA